MNRFANPAKFLLLVCFFTVVVHYSTSAQQFDVALTKTTITSGPVEYGTNIPFNLTISNNGTDTISNVVVRDFVNTGYVFDIADNPGWIMDPLNANAMLFVLSDKIAPGEIDIATIILAVQPAVDASEWENTGEIVSFDDRLGVDVTTQDVSSADNSDMATTPIVDVALKKELLTTGQVSYGDTLSFRTTIYNQGNILLSEVTIRDYIPEGYDNPVDLNTALGWSNMAVNPEFDYTNVAPGDSATSEIRLILTMTMVDANAWDNYSEVFLVRDDMGSIVFTDADSDPNSNTAAERTIRPGDADDNYIGNSPVNPGFQDDHDPAGPVINDLAVRKERLTGPSSYSYGQAIQYSIDILNQGNTVLQDIIYRDSLPCGIEDLDLSINPGWTYDAATRVATKTIAGPLDPATFDRDTLNLTVRPCTEDQYSAWTNVVEILEARDTDGNLITDIDSQADMNFSNDPGGVPGSPTDNIVNGDGIFDEDDHDIEAIEIVDIAIRKTVLTPGPYAEGDLIDFNIRVFNQGNVEATETYIEEFIPIGYTYSQAINGPLGWDQPVTLGATTVDRLAHTSLVPLAAGDSTDILLRLQLNFDGENPADWYNYAHVLITRDSLGNNRFDDADSAPFNETEEERLVIPGGPDDDNIFSRGENQGEDQDDHDPAGILFFDLSLEKLGSEGPYQEGQEIDFAFVLTNEGNTKATNIDVVDYVPCGFEFVADLNAANQMWDEDPVTGQVTFTYDVDTLDPGETDVLALTLIARSCTDAGAYRNAAEIASAEAPDGLPSDDQDSDPDNIPTNDPPGEDDFSFVEGGIIDLSLSKTFTTTPTSTAVGAVLEYTIAVTNEGTLPAANVTVTDYLPCGLTFTGSTGWAPAGNNIEFAVPGIINPGQTVLIPLELTIGTCTGTPDYTNTAEISSLTLQDGTPVTFDFDSTPDDIPTNDPAGEDDIDSVPFDVFDLSIQKLGGGNLLSDGDEVGFAIIVTNEGTITATNVEVTEYIPCGFEFDPAIQLTTMWSFDPVTGYATYNHPDPLVPGVPLLLDITLRVTYCNEPGAYTNAVEISNADDPNGDPIDDQDSTPDDIPTNDLPGEDDIATTVDNIVDLSLQKTFTTQPTSTAVGSTLDYTITVTNEGSVPMEQILITDYVPCGLTFVSSPGWEEEGDYIDYTITQVIAPGQSVDVPLQLVIGTCSAGETPDYTNVAEISAQFIENGPPVTSDFDSTPDTNPTNDPVGEDDIDSQPFDVFDLSLEKSILTGGSLSYGQNITYEIVVTNEGTITAETYSITEYLPCGLAFPAGLNTQWQVDNATGYLVLDETTALAPQATATYQLTLTLEPCDDPAATSAWNNTAEISAATDANGPADDQDSNPDNIPTNDPPGEDDIDTVPLDIYDLSLSKAVTSTATEYEEGDIVTYAITVTNEGNQPIGSYTVEDRLPCGLQLSSTSTNWTDQGGGVITSSVTATLSPGQSAQISLSVEVVECSTAGGETTNTAEIIAANDPNGEPVDDIDSTPDNNDPTEDDQDDATVIIVVGAVIGDFVFEDIDGDGVQDFGEPGIPGVTITVVDDNNMVVTTVTTDANGAYEVELPTGDYYLVFDAGEDLEPTLSGQGNPANDSNITGDFGPGSTSLFTVVNGEDDFTIDAGFYSCVTIRGTAWYDINENDIEEEWENGINGLTVNLYRNIGGTFQLVETQYTHHDPLTPSDDGLWDFCVSPGTYYVEVVMPPYGLVRVRPFIGGSSTDSDINNANGIGTTPQFTLVSGQSKADLGAGYYPMATVATSVWYDENQNGLRDAEEPAMANVEVQMYDEQHHMVAATVTDEDGEYLFDYLEKQSYYLKFEAPDGYTFTEHISGSETSNSDVTHANGDNTTDLIALEPGLELDFVDAGLRRGVLPVTWVSVEATNHGKYNEITWTSAQELNSSHYEVEYSADGTRYEVLEQVESKGSLAEVNYEVRHQAVAGTYYYRIKHQDVDGQYSYSQEVTATIGSKGAIALFPNPTAHSFTIAGVEDDLATVTIVSADGRVVKSERVADRATIDISALPAGVYSCHVLSAGVVTTQAVVKL